MRHPLIIPMVVGTIGFVALMTVGTLCYCSTAGIPAGPDVKEIAIAALAAISALLASTRNNPDTPPRVEISNTQANPVPTDPQP